MKKCGKHTSIFSKKNEYSEIEEVAKTISELVRQEKAKISRYFYYYKKY